MCTPLGSVVGGTGPVYTNNSLTGTYTGTYTCNSGYTLIGSADLTCNNATGTWSSNPPECINDKYYNDIDINDSGIPTWLAILLGVLAGIAALLLLTCLLLCCLRLCGCLPGSVFGGGSHVYPEDSGYTRCCYCCKSRDPYRRRRIHRGSRRRGYDSRSSSLVDVEDGPYVVTHEHEKYRQRRLKPNYDDGNQTSTYIANGRPPVHHENKHQQTLVRSNVVHTSTDSGLSSNNTRGGYIENGDVIGVHRSKKEAKEIKQWMPHSNPIRSINTSTK